MENNDNIKKELPLVSVIIPTFNRAYVLKESILSVLNQTYENIEVVIVDDCSTDDTEKVVSEINDERVVYVKNKYNQGAAASRNSGAELAKGDYLAFNDSDDLWLPEKVEHQINSLLDSECNISYCYLKRRKANNQNYSKVIPQISEIEELNGYLYKKLLVNNFIALPTLMIKKALFISANGFNSELRSLEDYEFLLRVTQKEKVIFVDKVLVDSRDFGDGINEMIKNPCDVCDGLLAVINENYAEIESDNIEFRLKAVLEEAASWLGESDFKEREKKICKYAEKRRIVDLKYIRTLSNLIDKDAIKLSLIIPFYNSEMYLEECLSSVTKMDFSPIEIICINDGSTDSSVKIVEKFSKIDSRIVLINKENTGYGNSVNLGLEIAKGEYIGIIESDDIVDADGYRKLIEVANGTSADIVKGNYSIFSKDISNATRFENLANMPYYRLFNLEYAPMLAITGPAIWSGIYRREFLLNKKIKLLNSPGASYQDTSFAFITFASANAIYLIENNIIFYRVDSEMSSSNSDKKVFDIFNETDYIRTYLIKNRMEKFLPLLARAKMQGQAWNYNRIGNEKKKVFMLRWHEDAIKDYIHGHIKQEYWDEESWIRINKVIYNPYYYSSDADLCKMDIREQLVAILRDIKEIYVLGIGDYAMFLTDILSNYGITITAFVDNSRENVGNHINNIPIVDIDSVSRECILLSGVSKGDPLLTVAKEKYYSVCDLANHLLK